MPRIIDTNDVVTGKLPALKADGVETVVRYLTTAIHLDKLVRPDEAKAIAAAGLKLALVFENYGGTDNFAHADIGAGTGKAHGEFALEYAPAVGAPDGAIVWFAIDTDVQPKEFQAYVVPYLTAVRQGLGGRFRVGLYSNGMACGMALDRGLADAAWLAQSRGWLGYASFRDSLRWHLLQGPETTLHGLSVDSNEANGPDYGQFVPFGRVYTAAPGPGNEAPMPAGARPGGLEPAPAGNAPAAFPGLPAILDLAGLSPARRGWNNGDAPAGYVKGMAAAYARLHAAWHDAGALALAMALPASGRNGDFLTWYAEEFHAAGLDVSKPGPATLQALFTGMMGLGMRESSGKFCEGRDVTARIPPSSDSVEAGLFQMSWDAHVGVPEMVPLLQSYKAAGDDPEGLGPIFHEGVTCTEANLANFGHGDGLDFQRIAKASPMFAVATAGIALRSIGGHMGHWGPIRRKEAQIRLAAFALFKQVGALVDQARAAA